MQKLLVGTVIGKHCHSAVLKADWKRSTRGHGGFTRRELVIETGLGMLTANKNTADALKYPYPYVPEMPPLPNGQIRETCADMPGRGTCNCWAHQVGPSPAARLMIMSHRPRLENSKPFTYQHWLHNWLVKHSGGLRTLIAVNTFKFCDSVVRIFANGHQELAAYGPHIGQAYHPTQPCLPNHNQQIIDNQYMLYTTGVVLSAAAYLQHCTFNVTSRCTPFLFDLSLALCVHMQHNLQVQATDALNIETMHITDTNRTLCSNKCTAQERKPHWSV